MRFGLFLVCCLLPCCSPALDNSLELTQYGVQNWQVGNGLPQNTVNAVTQTKDGYLWIGTEGGLARFDGFRFAVFTTENTPALRSNNIRSLCTDREGALQIRTADGPVRWQNGSFASATGSAGCAGVLDNGMSEVRDTKGRLWTGTEHGLQMFEGARIRTYRTEDGLPGNRITALLPDRAGVIWVGTDAGMARIMQDRIERFPAGRPVFSDPILSLASDGEGNLWVGTDGSGLTMLRNMDFLALDRNEGANDRIRCVLQDRQNRVWIGTDGNGLRMLDGKQSKQFTTADGLGSNVVLSLTNDRTGDLWIGTPLGLYRMHNGRFSAFASAADGLAEDFVRSLHGDPDGTLWVGTRHGLSAIRNGSVKTYNQADGLGSDVIGALLRGSDGELWIGTLDGLTRWKDGRFQTFHKHDGLPSEVITELFLDGDGVLWIGTQGGGLCFYKAGIIHRLGRHPELPDTVYGITDDRFGNLWMAAKTGIFRVKKLDLQRGVDDRSSFRVDSFGPADGVRVSECDGGGHPTIWKKRDGTILFSTAKGVAVLPVRKADADRRPPSVVLQSVSIDERTFSPPSNLVIEPGHSRVDFEYAGIHFGSPQKVRYRYRLDGFDRDWVNAGTRRVASYTNLPPGRRFFHVIASSEDGVWSPDTARFAFTLKPHFYQTWTFDVGLLCLAGLLIYLFNRWRVRQVLLRYDAILGERNRIAREIHDTLAQGFVGVSMQLEIASRLLKSSAIVDATQYLEQARALVRTSLADARQSIWELRSQSSEQEDFAAKLANAAKQTAGASPNTKVRLQVHGTYRPLEPAIESELLSIGKEAVANAVRHSGAQTISIELSFDPQRFRMIVGDDGCGFDPAMQNGTRANHYGLQGMNERAEKIGAQLRVRSELNRGTEVIVERHLP